jgi:hypothetical protein
MMARARGRTSNCTAADAAKRLAQARGFLDVAELYEGEEPNVAASNAVLAAIAASDAACCAALGYHATGEAHDEAVTHLSKVAPDGRAAANALRRALGVKSKAQYSLSSISDADRDTALRQARKLIGIAEKLVRG